MEKSEKKAHEYISNFWPETVFLGEEYDDFRSAVKTGYEACYTKLQGEVLLAIDEIYDNHNSEPTLWPLVELLKKLEWLNDYKELTKAT